MAWFRRFRLMVALVVGLCSVERLDCIGYRRLVLDSGQAPAISGLCEAVISGGNHWNSVVLVLPVSWLPCAGISSHDRSVD